MTCMTPNEILAYGFIAFVLLTLSHSFAYRKGEDSATKAGRSADYDALKREWEGQSLRGDK